MINPLIKIENLSKFYQIGNLKTQVLKEINIAINSGELVAIVGASGSGKSTLMNIIGLLDRADAGNYYLQGVNVDKLSEDDKAIYRNQYIGFVFQQFNLLPRLTARQNVALPLHYRNSSPEEIDASVEQALQRVGMTSFAEHRPTQLSGGQQQRVAIARALVSKPQVLLADEPTGALDSKTGSEVMNLFHSLHHEGRTIIMVTHDQQIASQCERQITLADGQIIKEACDEMA